MENLKQRGSEENPPYCRQFAPKKIREDSSAERALLCPFPFSQIYKNELTFFEMK